MPREIYFVSPIGKDDKVRPTISELNSVLNRIGARLDKGDGTRGIPKFGSNVNVNGKTLFNVGDAQQPNDALSLTFADDRYVRQAPGLALLVIGALQGMAIDAGVATVTGSKVVGTRLGNVNYALACLGADPSATIWPGVEALPGGRNITIKTWMPNPVVIGTQTAVAPALIASTSAVNVYWFAVGPDITGGAVLNAAAGVGPTGKRGSQGGGAT